MLRPTVTAIACVLCWVATASATPRVALTTIVGDHDGDMREAVVAALASDDLKLVSHKATTRAIDRAGGDLFEMSGKQLRKLARDLDADAIVHVRLGREGRSKVLKFKLFVDGKRIKGFSVIFKRARTKKFRVALHDKMLEKLASVSHGRRARGHVRDDADDDDDALGEDDEQPAPLAARSGKRRRSSARRARPEDAEDAEDAEHADAEDADAGEDAGDRDETADGADDDGEPRRGRKRTAARDDEDGGELGVAVRAPRRGARHAANHVAIRLDVGGSVSQRRLEFTTRSDLAPEIAPQAFRPGPVPGARFELEMYPLAFGNPTGLLAGLGLAVDYDKVLSSKVQVSKENSVDDGKISTVNQQIYTVSARYRIAFGRSATSPTVTLGLGYGRRTFQVNSTLADRANLDLPDTDYKYLAPLFAFRLPLAPSFAVVGSAEGMLVRDAGPIQESDSYGRAKVFGVDAAAGVDIVFGQRFALRLLGELTQIGFEFVGAGGDLANNRDGDPMTKDVGGALDRSFGGSATLAILY